MRVALDETGLEATLEEVTDSTMAPIEALRVDTIQLTHPLRKRWLDRLQNEVIVIVHQAPSETAPAIAFTDERDEVEKGEPVGRVREDRFPLVSARGDVV